MSNSNLVDKKGALWYFFYYILKVNDLTYYQRSRYVILNRAEDYYQNDRVRLKDQAKNKYRHLSEE